MTPATTSQSQSTNQTSNQRQEVDAQLIQDLKQTTKKTKQRWSTTQRITQGPKGKFPSSEPNPTTMIGTSFSPKQTWASQSIRPNRIRRDPLATENPHHFETFPTPLPNIITKLIPYTPSLRDAQIEVTKTKGSFDYTISLLFHLYSSYQQQGWSLYSSLRSPSSSRESN